MVIHKKTIPLNQLEGVMVKSVIVCFMLLGISTLAYSQEARATASTQIKGKSVTIEYGSPALKGRNLAEFMQQLPADRIWRAGAGGVTALTTEADLLIGGKKVPAGKYSLYMHCPEDGKFSLVINSDPGRPLGEIIPNAPPERAKQIYPRFWAYTKDIGDKEVARVSLKQAEGENKESLIYSFQPSGNGSSLTISWEKQSWTVEFQPAD
jgi:hypothetical protein